MHWLLFIARLAFICNLCFIISVALRYSHLNLPQGLVGIIVALGYLAIIINAVLHIGLLFLRKHPITRWLKYFNLGLFLLQVAYFFL